MINEEEFRKGVVTLIRFLEYGDYTIFHQSNMDPTCSYAFCPVCIFKKKYNIDYVPVVEKADTQT